MNQFADNYEELLSVYGAMIDSIEGVQRKGKTMPYTSMNGNMYSFLSKEGQIALRLGKEDKKIFNDEINPDPMIQYGAVMRGYVTIPENMLASPDQLNHWFKRCHDNAMTLKPKPTKKPKK